MRKLTDYPELDKVFYELAEAYKKALCYNFVGLYIQGSLAVGDFDMTKLLKQIFSLGLMDRSRASRRLTECGAIGLLCMGTR